MKNKLKFIMKIAGKFILISFLLFQLYILARQYLFASCVIPTYSMSPTLVEGDYIIASLCIPGRRVIEKDIIRPGHYNVQRKKGTRSLQKGDVVVFNFPYSKGADRMQMDFNMYFCKRCVEIPGKIYYWQGNEGLDSVYLPRKEETVIINSSNFHQYRRCIEYETGLMPKLLKEGVIHADTLMRNYRFQSNYYFVRGDNYADSYDSRFWGILPEDFILGVGLFTWFSKEPGTGRVRWERMLKKYKL